MEYTVTVSGPKGVKHVVVPAEQVEFFLKETGTDAYQTAAWLAYCDLWTRSTEMDEPAPAERTLDCKE